MRHENALRRAGFEVVAGLDEAGRGPLAGPVVAAAVVLPTGFRHRWVDDSKKLDAGRREAVCAELVGDVRVAWSVGVAQVEEIDRVNVLRATWLAMGRAVEGLMRRVDLVLVDGLEVGEFGWAQRPLVGGDGISKSIAAASVIAKVERDRMMVEYARRYPQYGFERHKGYGTAVHLEALREHGPCPIHRRSFQPVAQLALEGGG